MAYARIMPYHIVKSINIFCRIPMGYSWKKLHQVTDLTRLFGRSTGTCPASAIRHQTQSGAPCLGPNVHHHATARRALENLPREIR